MSCKVILIFLYNLLNVIVIFLENATANPIIVIPNPENNHSLLSQIHLNILPTIITPLYL